ncbi:MAG: magnesium transporter CorA family protein [Bacteroidetes bacterium]|nr:magnesium transporter CorA family protein [Bacteroidota bacterium]
MIEYFGSVNNVVTKLPALDKKCWINVTAPSTQEIELLTTQFKIPIEILTDILDSDESARIEVEGRYLIIIVKIPVLNSDDSDIPYVTVPLGILISNDYFISVSNIENDITNDVKNNRIKNFDMGNHRRFVLQMFLRISTQYLRNLKDISRTQREIEKKINISVKNEELLKLLDMEKSLVYFSTSLKSNELMIEKLKRSKFSKMNEEDEDLIDDVIIENRQAIEQTSIHTNIMSGTMDTFASIISNNQNVVIKTLTTITIVLMIPTLISSFFGMNVNPDSIPFSLNPHGFTIILFCSIMLSTIGYLYFRKKDLF